MTKLPKNFTDWLKLMCFLEHLLNEEEITSRTYESMVDALMILKPIEEAGL